MWQSFLDSVGMTNVQFFSLVFAYVSVVVVTEYSMYRVKQRHIEAIMDICYSQGMSRGEREALRRRLKNLGAIDVVMIAEEFRRDNSS